jgi:hypothetical protein
MKPNPNAKQDRRVVADRRSKTRGGRRSADAHDEERNAQIEQFLKSKHVQKTQTKKKGAS